MKYLCFVAIFIIGFLAYKLAISRTVEIGNEIEKLEAQLSQSTVASQNLEQLKSQLTQMKSKLGASDISPDQIQQSMLDRVESMSEELNLNIKEVYPIHFYQAEDYQVITNSAKIEGDFRSLLLLNDELERRFPESNLMTVNYESEKKTFNRKKKLYATYYLQNIRRK